MGFLTMLRNEKKNRETTLRIPMSHLEEYHAEPSYMNDAEMEEYMSVLFTMPAMSGMREGISSKVEVGGKIYSLVMAGEKLRRY